MRDPDEGIGPDGAIVTGVDRGRVADRFEPVLDAAVAAIGGHRDASLFVYGSVATGQARDRASDVDLVAIGLPSDAAARVGAELSLRFADRCRAVELSTVAGRVLRVGGDEADGDDASGDEAYGDRVFMRHYCAHVAGPDLARGLPVFLADVRAARGFNGDIAGHADRWRAALAATDGSVGASTALGRRLARKSLFAVAGLASVHDGAWTAAVSWLATVVSRRCDREPRRAGGRPGRDRRVPLCRPDR